MAKQRHVGLPSVAYISKAFCIPFTCKFPSSSTSFTLSPWSHYTHQSNQTKPAQNLFSITTKLCNAIKCCPSFLLVVQHNGKMSIINWYLGLKKIIDRFISLKKINNLPTCKSGADKLACWSQRRTHLTLQVWECLISWQESKKYFITITNNTAVWLLFVKLMFLCDPPK